MTLLTPFLILCPSFQTKATFNLLLNGKAAGTGVEVQQLASDGSLRETLTVTGHAKGGTQRLTFEKLLNSQGVAQERSLSGITQNTQLNVAVRFGSQTATVTAAAKGKKISKTVAIPRGRRAETSAFWFLKYKPKVGATSEYEQFDLSRGSWRHVRDTYTGDTTYHYHGRAVKAHRIDHLDGYDLEDDHGLAYIAVVNGQGGKTVFVRQ